MEKLTQCLNCEWDLPKEENFCPNCGQKNHATRLKIRSFLNELINVITIKKIRPRIWCRCNYNIHQKPLWTFLRSWGSFLKSQNLLEVFEIQESNLKRVTDVQNYGVPQFQIFDVQEAFHCTTIEDPAELSIVLKQDTERGGQAMDPHTADADITTAVGKQKGATSTCSMFKKL